MPLIPCRACSHSVDISALACPRCGATDPARKISRQQRELRIFAIQAAVGTLIVGIVAWVAWHELIPVVRASLLK
jgi:hypothetical protein